MTLQVPSASQPGGLQPRGRISQRGSGRGAALTPPCVASRALPDQAPLVAAGDARAGDGARAVDWAPERADTRRTPGQEVAMSRSRSQHRKRKGRHHAVRLARPGTPPGVLLPSPTASPTQLRAVTYGPEGCYVHEL